MPSLELYPVNFSTPLEPLLLCSWFLQVYLQRNVVSVNLRILGHFLPKCCKLYHNQKYEYLLRNHITILNQISIKTFLQNISTEIKMLGRIWLNFRLKCLLQTQVNKDINFHGRIPLWNGDFTSTLLLTTVTTLLKAFGYTLTRK